MMCPVRTNGRPLIFMSHMCVDMTCLPSANAAFRGHVVSQLLMMLVPSSITKKICVAPESAMAAAVIR